MRIDRLSIDGFGIFCDTSLADLPSGLVLFQGANEAGKSTLLGFIRAMLFGFPRKNAREPDYPPLAGGRHGGRLGLAMADGGAYAIERYQGKKGGATVYGPDGAATGEDVLPRLLGGASAAVFKNIYAFSLSELQTFETLQDQGVKGAIYGAGAGIAAGALPAADKQIAKQLEGLFKPGGSKPRINQRLRDFEDIRSQLSRAIAGAGQYDQRTAELRRTEERIAELETEIARIYTQRDRVDGYKNLWEDWINLQQFEQELEGLPAIESFPEDGVARLDQERVKLHENRETRGQLEADIEDRHREAEDLVIDTAVLEQADAIQLLARGRDRYEEGVGELPLSRQQRSTMNRDIRASLDTLGAGWGEERVFKVDRSLFTREGIRKHEADLNDCANVRVAAAQTLARCTEECDRAKDDAAVAQRRLDEFAELPPEPDQRIVQRLQAGRGQMDAVVRDLPAVETELRQEREQLARDLKEIHPRWTPEDVGRFDCSVAAQQKIEEFERRLAAGDRAVADAQSQCREREAAAGEGRQRLKAAREELESCPKPPVESREVLTQRRTDAVALRDAVLKRDRLAGDVRHQEERLADKRQEFERSGAGQARGVGVGYGWPAVLAFWALLSLLIEDFLIKALAFSAFLLLAVVFLLRAWRRKAPAARADDPLAQQVAAIAEGLDGQRAELAAVEEGVREDAARLDLVGAPEFAAVVALDNQIQEDLVVFDRWQRHEQEIRKFEEDVKRLDAALEAAQQDLGTCEQEQQALRAEWESHLDRVDLPADMTPRSVVLVSSKVESVMRRLKAMEDLEERIRRMKAAAQAYRDLAAQMPSLAPSAGETLGELLSQADRFFGQLRQQQALRQESELAQQAFAEKQGNAAKAVAKLEQARVALDHAQECEAEADGAWGGWLADNDLPGDLSPSTALEALERIEKCVARIGQRNDVDARVEELDQRIAQFERQADEVMAALGRPACVQNALCVAIEGLVEEVARSKQNHAAKARIMEDVSRLTARLDSTQERIAESEDSIQEMIQAGGASDEEAFRERGRVAAQRADLENRVAETKRILLKVSGQSDLDELKGNLSALTRDQLLTDEKELSLKAEELEAERQELGERRAALRHEIEQMQGADDIARLRADEERLKAEIRGEALEWARYAVARHLLERARAKYEKEQQPKVIQDAGRFFAAITGGRYCEVVAPIGQDTIEAVAPDGERKRPEQLSRGSAEQLYLAVRFGYIRHHASSGEPLPIIMDDILVNFDPERASSAAKAILELSHTHQVLFFTCHPEVVDVFQALEPDVPIYGFGDGKLNPLSTA